MTECCNPNCLNNSKACKNFEKPNTCLKETFCEWQKLPNYHSVMEHCFTRKIEGINL